MDWLMQTALDALEDNSAYSNMDKENLSKWLAHKRKEKAKATRLESLRFICHTLDQTNQRIVCDALDISLSDLQATARVLQRV